MTGLGLGGNGAGLRRFADPSVVRSASDRSRPLSLTVLFLSAVLCIVSAVFLPATLTAKAQLVSIVSFFPGALGGFDGFLSVRKSVVEMFGSVGHVLGTVPQMLTGHRVLVIGCCLRMSRQRGAGEYARSIHVGSGIRGGFSADDLLPSNAVGSGNDWPALCPPGGDRIYVAERWRRLAAFGAGGFSPEFLELYWTTAGREKYILRPGPTTRGGCSRSAIIDQMTEPLPWGSPGTLRRL